MGSLDNQVAVITGSSSGIGRAIATLFSAEGASVVINSKQSVDQGTEFAASLPDAIYVQADVSVEEEAQALVQAAADRWRRVDIVVNNAGYADMIDHRDLESLTAEVWRRDLDINLMSTWFVSKAAIPHMQQVGGGSIINVTSLAGVHPTASGSCIAYGVAKAAVNHMTILLANAFGEDNIRVNALAVGPIETPMWKMDRNKMREAVRQRTLLQRPGQPEEVAQNALSFAAPGFVTAQVLIVDGGMRFRVPR